MGFIPYQQHLYPTADAAGPIAKGFIPPIYHALPNKVQACLIIVVHTQSIFSAAHGIG